MNRHLSLALKVTGIAIIVLIVIYSGIAVVVYSSSGAFPVRRTPYPPVRINNLIWPSIGYPAMVAPGSSLTVEFDFNLPGELGGPQPRRPAAWRATLEPVRPGLEGLSYRIKSSGARRGPSSRWPSGTSRGSQDQVWHAEFAVPGNAVPELYDLTVQVESGGRIYTDSQPHAVAVTKAKDGEFRFITLADIHVHRRNISALFQPQTNKGITPEGRPVFFERAIDQVNLIRPDFVVMLGDYVRAQHSPGDYQVEFENFYNALSRFEVPVFMIPGNHDVYINEVDGAVIWEESIGPLHYSFDVGGCHFSAVNTSDWPRSDRIVMRKLGVFVYPRKWQGQVLDADNERNVEEFRGQLAWLRDDLAEHQSAAARFLLLHHSPFTPDGEGISFENQRFAGLYTLGGDGMGKTALMELCSRYRVDLALSGHLHIDDVGEAGWADGEGRTVFATQTCVYYDEGGEQENYPGYRLVEVAGGKVGSFAYVNGVSSIPFYDGSSISGRTDLDKLDRPALSSTKFVFDDAAGEQGTGAGQPPGGTAGRTGWLVDSFLAVPMELEGLVMEVPHLREGYAAAGGEIYRYVRVPDTDRALVYVRAVTGRGVPGKSATRPGEPSRKEVTVSAETAAGLREATGAR